MNPIDSPPTSPPQIDEAGTTTTPTTLNGSANPSDQSFTSIRDRLRFKRNPSHQNVTTIYTKDNRDKTKSCSDRNHSRNRWPHNNIRNRKGVLSGFQCRGVYLLYLVIVLAVFSFVFASVVLQNSITGMIFTKGWIEYRRSVKEGLMVGSSLRFVPDQRLRWLVDSPGLHHLPLNQARLGIRLPRIAVILGNMKKDPHSLMLVTVMMNLQKLGYTLKIYAVTNGRAKPLWEHVGGKISILGRDQYTRIDWSNYEGIVADSFEAKVAISSLMQEPFCSIPLIWIIQEDTLASRLPFYEKMGAENLVSHWKRLFSRANVLVFPDFTLPMLYSVLDTGNFFVIPGSPVDVWAAEIYGKTYSKNQLRMTNGFSKDDIVVLVVGSPFYYDELSWDYAVAMHALGPLLVKYTTKRDVEGSFKFAFLCGNSTDSDAFQEVASHINLVDGSIRHYGLNGNVNSVLLMADIVLYGSIQDEQSFPPLIIRAMTFEIPVILPEIPIFKKYVVDGANALLYPKYEPEALMSAFSLMISDGRLSQFAHELASSGRQLAKNLLASESINGYARLVNNVLSFPSDVLLPGPLSRLERVDWEWRLFGDEIEYQTGDFEGSNGSVVLSLEEELTDLVHSTDMIKYETEVSVRGNPTDEDWDVLREIESLEEYEILEIEELEERMEKSPGIWGDIYRNARKSEKLRFEPNERDEGELERTGQLVCIFEIYSGLGAWPFLHHGSLYRGLSLSSKARRSSSDDVDAVSRLPLLNDTYYKDVLCEIGGMFAIANKVDDVHMRPWIGFQSWRAAGRKVSLSVEAENALEENIHKEIKGDAIYFWARLDMDAGKARSNDELSFWSICDILNSGQCRNFFGDAFRQMYDLPSELDTLPPMPGNGGYWSGLHCWVMATPSFLEFVMFSRMFVDSLDALQYYSGQANTCPLSSSKLEAKHCYCRILELLVNVWAYHSGRRMVFIDPQTGALEEQHPINSRKGRMWAKYFNVTLLKSMDEDLAETADDADHPRGRWLWPLTGEVHWQGIYEGKREERYRIKMDKKRKLKEKIYERMKSGYKQKPLGR